MNTRKTVYEKLFSNQATELTSQEVELAMFKSVQEIEKQYAAQPTGVARLVRDPVTGVYRYVME